MAKTSSTTTRLDKGKIRRDLRAALRAMPATTAARASSAICERLRPLLARGTVLAFSPLPGEVNIEPLLHELDAEGRLVLPRVDGWGLSLHRVASPGLLGRGAHGIAEPGPDLPRATPGEIQTVLVPGLGFTEAGARLGRGGGYFDRLLPTLGARRVGVCFSLQVLPDLPTEEHDAPVDIVVHEGRQGGGDDPAGQAG